MKQIKAVLIREKEELTQTTGTIKLIGDGWVTEYKTLELPWRENQRNISCIPKGVYKVTPRWSPKFKNHYQIQDVEKRAYILIHAGNTYKQTQGCILVGKTLQDISWDGIKDVTHSRETLDLMLRVAPQGFQLTII